jgi:hypothetical protein
VFQKNLVAESLNSAQDLAGYALKDGIYVIEAKDAGGLGHCFVLQVTGSTRIAFDDFDEVGGRVDYTSCSLLSLEWVRQVNFARKVERFKVANKRGTGYV